MIRLTDADATREFGQRLAAQLRAGDVVVLTGPLGAGKTTLTQGIGQGLNVRGRVTSPTFTISRIHPSLVGGPDLVHVDAYRLTDLADVETIDLDATIPTTVTIIEWGEELIEELGVDYLAITLDRSGDEDDLRTATVRGVGQRWRDLDL